MRKMRRFYRANILSHATIVMLSLFGPMNVCLSISVDGMQAYTSNCAACHGASLDGSSGPSSGPPLRGALFAAKWNETPTRLLQYIQSQMPLQKPNSLDSATYAAITAFILGENSELVDSGASGNGEIGISSEAHDNYYDAIFRRARARLDTLIGHVPSVTDEELEQPPAMDWLSWRGSSATLGYSALRDIRRDNVSRLTAVWSAPLGSGENGIAPLVHDGVMYINSNGTVEALDATNGDVIWTFSRPARTTRVPHSQPRSMALYGDAIYVPTIDCHLLALDARTGRLLWDHEISDRLELTAGPLAVRGRVVQGVSGCLGDDFPGGCFIVALDAATGREIWRLYTIARPGQEGGNTWNGAPLEGRFGGSVWSTGSYDSTLNLLYFGTGQTYVVSTLLKSNDGPPESRDALFTDTTLAINPDTGKLVWYYQHAAADVWDQDWAFERSLITLHTPHGPIRAVCTVGKPGIMDLLDAKTGRYLWSVDMGLQNLIVAIDPLTGRKTYDPNLTPETTQHKLICPSSYGNRNWPSTAYSPTSHLIYLPLNHSCSDMRLLDMTASNVHGMAEWDVRETARLPPNAAGLYGRIVAVDLQTRKVVWSNRRRAPQTSGVLVTGGGLVFEGGSDRWFRALDSSTGRTLWQTRLANAPSSFPLAYKVGTTEYIAVVVGEAGVDYRFSIYTPELPLWGTGKEVVVFALGGTAFVKSGE